MLPRVTTIIIVEIRLLATGCFDCTLGASLTVIAWKESSCGLHSIHGMTSGTSFSAT